MVGRGAEAVDVSRTIKDELGIAMAHIHCATFAHGDTIGQHADEFDKACVAIQRAIDMDQLRAEPAESRQPTRQTPRRPGALDG
ncbi:hypothetical protein LCGC14_1282000 [marine sediment metagenome]|uniref:Uncharacterized protein n=1 Tax=marine sediment metagenome TaxID=412755 RepID=A0A0F9NBH9_9ZZZZ